MKPLLDAGPISSAKKSTNWLWWRSWWSDVVGGELSCSSRQAKMESSRNDDSWHICLQSIDIRDHEHIQNNRNKVPVSASVNTNHHATPTLNYVDILHMTAEDKASIFGRLYVLENSFHELKETLSTIDSQNRRISLAINSLESEIKHELSGIQAFVARLSVQCRKHSEFIGILKISLSFAAGVVFYVLSIFLTRLCEKPSHSSACSFPSWRYPNVLHFRLELSLSRTILSVTKRHVGDLLLIFKDNTLCFIRRCVSLSKLFVNISLRVVIKESGVTSIPKRLIDAQGPTYVWSLNHNFWALPNLINFE